jgi:hypothetical protein
VTTTLENKRTVVAERIEHFTLEEWSDRHKAYQRPTA